MPKRLPRRPKRGLQDVFQRAFWLNVDVYKNFLQLSSNYVANPKFVRYSWSDTAKATLFNNEGLPASQFSSEYISAINQ